MDVERKGERDMRGGQLWFAVLALLAVLLGRLLTPVGAREFREELARLLADDRQSAEALQAVGRALSGGDWREELVEALGLFRDGLEAEA